MSCSGIQINDGEKWNWKMERRGLTLLELVVTLAIVVATASVAVLGSGALLQDSRGDVTRQSLKALRDVIAQTYWQDNSLTLPRPNMAVTITHFPNRQNAAQLRYLFVNPATEDTTVTYNPAYRLGWRGPYVVANNGSVYTINATANFTEQYGENGDPAVLDGWGNPIVIQNPGTWADGSQDVRLVSAGPNGIVNIDPTTPTATLLANPNLAGDDAYIYFEVR